MLLMIEVYVDVYLFIRNLFLMTTDRMHGLTFNKCKGVKTDLIFTINNIQYDSYNNYK